MGQRSAEQALIDVVCGEHRCDSNDAIHRLAEFEQADVRKRRRIEGGWQHGNAPRKRDARIKTRCREGRVFMQTGEAYRMVREAHRSIVAVMGYEGSGALECWRFHGRPIDREQLFSPKPFLHDSPTLVHTRRKVMRHQHPTGPWGSLDAIHASLSRIVEDATHLGLLLAGVRIIGRCIHRA